VEGTDDDPNITPWYNISGGELDVTFAFNCRSVDDQIMFKSYFIRKSEHSWFEGTDEAGRKEFD
jgi:hypothetical protein